MPYLPSTDGTPINRPIGATNGPDGARTYFHDTTNFTYRPFVSTSEVLTYLDTDAKRKGHVSIIVNVGGSLAAGVITGGKNYEYWFKDDLTNSGLILKSPSIYFNSNNLTGDVTNASPLDLTETGITAGTFTNATVTFDKYGRASAASTGTGGGSITSFVTATDIEITDNTKGIIRYDANNTKWRQTIGTNGADVNTNVYLANANAFRAEFTGTAGTNFSAYTPDDGKAHVNTSLSPVTLDGSGNAVFSNLGVAQIIVDTPIPAFRKTTIIVAALTSQINNRVQHTVLFSVGGATYVTASVYYRNSTQVYLLIANQAGTLASSVDITVTYPFTFTVTYTSPGRVVMNLGANSLSWTVSDLTGLINYADFVSVFGASLSQAKVEYQPFVDPIVFFDNFTGSAGNYTGHTADVGTATVTTGGSFKPLAIDGSGNAVFDATGVTQLVPAGTLTSSRKSTAVIVSLPVGGGGNLFQLGILQNPGNTIYRFVSVQYVDSTHVALVIAGEGGPIAFNSSIAITYPITLTATFDGTTISANVNGLTPVTTTNIGTSLLNYADFVGVNGPVLTSAKVENI